MLVLIDADWQLHIIYKVTKLGALGDSTRYVSQTDKINQFDNF